MCTKTTAITSIRPLKLAGRLTPGLDVTGGLLTVSATYDRHREVSAADTAERELPTDAYGDPTVALEYQLETWMQTEIKICGKGS